jgi:hypothetical protein
VFRAALVSVTATLPANLKKLLEAGA